MTEGVLTRLGRRTLAEAGCDGPALERYKQDGRSTVWRVATAGGDRVVKRFAYSPLRQRAGLMAGLHPGQLEMRWNRRLIAAGVRAVPVVDGGYEPVVCGLFPGVMAWLATPWRGESMQRLLASDARVGALIEAAAAVTRDLFAAGLWSRDLKPSNLVIDEAGRAWMIDVGSVRRGLTEATRARTVAVMERVLGRDGVDEAMRRRYVELASSGGPTGKVNW